MTSATGKKTVYLGDGLYAEDDGYQFRLYTEGFGGGMEVFLEDQVFRNFLKFAGHARGIVIATHALPPPGADTPVRS